MSRRGAGDSRMNITREINKVMQVGDRNNSQSYGAGELDVKSIASKILNRSFNNINVIMPGSQLS